MSRPPSNTCPSHPLSALQNVTRTGPLGEIPTSLSRTIWSDILCSPGIYFDVVAAVVVRFRR